MVHSKNLERHRLTAVYGDPWLIFEGADWPVVMDGAVEAALMLPRLSPLP
jgi:hypothetical protein